MQVASDEIEASHQESCAPDARRVGREIRSTIPPSQRGESHHHDEASDFEVADPEQHRVHVRVVPDGSSQSENGFHRPRFKSARIARISSISRCCPVTMVLQSARIL